MSNRINAQEIFDVGEWNGLPFTDEDLNQIVDSFNKFNKLLKVPLKLGHNKEQPVTDGEPALGWVEKIYRKGTKLVADLIDVPDVIRAAIEKKLYRTVSVELLSRVKYQNEEHPWVLQAVALLGADVPAVNTLEDLNAYMTQSSIPNYQFEHGSMASFAVIRGAIRSETPKSAPPKPPTRGTSHMDKSDVQTMIEAQVGPLNEQIATFKTQVTELSNENETLRQERDAAVAKFKQTQEDARKASIKAARDSLNALFEKAVKSETITPAQRESYVKLFKVENDDAVVGLDLDSVASAIGYSEEDHMDRRSKSFTAGDESRSDDPEEFLLGKTNAFMLEHNVDDFTAAFTKVCRAHPEEHKAYLTLNGG